MSYNQFYANFRVSVPIIILPSRIAADVVDDVSGEKHDVHVLSISYIKTSSHLIFCALIIIITEVSGYVDYTALRSSDSFCNILGIKFYHIYDTTEVTAIVVTYLQIENIHKAFVKGINIRIVVMARPKTSLFTYTSPSMPRYVVLTHTIAVIL